MFRSLEFLLVCCYKGWIYKTLNLVYLYYKIADTNKKVVRNHSEKTFINIFETVEVDGEFTKI
jgi:hypothetical protein